MLFLIICYNIFGLGMREVSLMIVLWYVYCNNMLVGYIFVWYNYVEYFVCKVIGMLRECFIMI